MAMLLYFLMARATVSCLGAAMAGNYLYQNGDFGTMWRAGQLLRAGQVLRLYDPARFDAWLRMVGGALPSANWLNAPPMGLLAIPLSAGPEPAMFWAWRSASAIIAALLLRQAGLGWGVIVLGLAGPAASLDVLLGQNGMLTAGLLVAGLLLVTARPGFAGVLFGLLLIKPQIGVLLPAVLLQRGRSSVIAVAILTALGLVVISGLVEGWDAWRYFFTLARPNAARILDLPFGVTFQRNSFTVFMMARSLDWPLNAAWRLQGLASGLALAAGWWLWQARDSEPVARMAATVALTTLAMPYGFNYDLVSFSIAAAALVPLAPVLVWPVLAWLWVFPDLDAYQAARTGMVLLPVAGLALLAIAWPIAMRPSRR